MVITKTIYSGKQIKFAISILLIFIEIQSQSISVPIPYSSMDKHANSIFLKNRNVLHCDSNALKVHRNKIVSVSLCGHYYRSAETDSIVIDGVKGIPFQDSWIFQKRKGNISLYTNLPDKSDNKITFISKKDSICPYSLSSLSKFVGDDHRSYSLVKMKMIADGFTYIPVTLGLTCAIAQIFHKGYIANTTGHGLNITASFFLLGVAVGLPSYFARNNPEKAINNYNSINFKSSDD